jgi:hypothetical protein
VSWGFIFIKKIGGEQIMWFQVSTGGNSFLKDEKLETINLKLT